MPIELNKLPHEIKENAVTFMLSKDLSALARTSKDNYLLFKPMLDARKLSLHVARGEQDAANAMLKKDIGLLAKIGPVTDYSNRTFSEITAFQYALWAQDSHMWQMMLDVLQEWANEGDNYARAEEIRTALQKQYNDVLEHGVDYMGIIYTWDHVAKTLVETKVSIVGEKHFNLQPLIDAINTYVKQFDNWSLAQWEEHWCHVVGPLQRLVPAHVAQHYCEDKLFDGKKPFNGAAFSRSLQFYNSLLNRRESWFPLSRDKQDNRLGFDFAIYNWPAPRVLAGGRAARQGALLNLAALSALCEVGTSNIAGLSERLATPLQKQDLDASHRMS